MLLRWRRLTHFEPTDALTAAHARVALDRGAAVVRELQAGCGEQPSLIRRRPHEGAREVVARLDRSEEGLCEFELAHRHLLHHRGAGVNGACDDTCMPDPVSTRIADGLRTADAALTLGERLASLFRRTPLQRAAYLRNRAADLLVRAAGAPTKRALRLRARAAGLSAEADVLEGRICAE